MGRALKAFLEPKSIAIVGASRTPDRPGYMIIENLKDFGFAGEIYPVNPGGGTVLGCRVYKSIAEVPENIDLAVSMVPAEETLTLLKDCAAKGIKNIILVSSGFSESGQQGERLQSEAVAFAKGNGMRLMGPNAVGPVNTSHNLVLPFYPIDSIKRGGVAFIAQSGQFCCPIMESVNSSLNLGVSKSIDVGNCCDVDEAEVLEYLEGDPETRVIAIYMESIRAGRRFLDIAKRVSRKKPLVLLKSGKTESGLRTAASHTGAIAVDDTVFDAALRQAGVIRAKDLEEFLDIAKVFDYARVPAGNRIAVVTYSGGVGSMVADACEQFGLQLAELSGDMVERIRPVLPRSTKISNPLDCFSAGVPADVYHAYKVPITTLIGAEDVDMVLCCFVVNRVWRADPERLLKDLKEFPPKPIAAWVIGEEARVREYSRTLEDGGIPVFASPERAIRALGALYGYHAKREGARP